MLLTLVYIYLCCIFRAEVAGALQMRSRGARIELIQNENSNNTDGVHMSCATYSTLKL